MADLDIGNSVFLRFLADTIFKSSIPIETSVKIVGSSTSKAAS